MSVPRRERGFVNHTIQFTIVGFGIWAAIAIPALAGYFAKKNRHACALRLDAAVALPEPAGTCAISEAPFTVENGKVCDPEAHGLSEKMCATAAEPAAVSHPAPSAAWTIGIVVGGFVTFVILVLFFF